MAEEMVVKARVRHEQDRSYTVLVVGPAGEAEVGTTTETGQLLSLAEEGAARLLRMPSEQIVVELVMPRPALRPGRAASAHHELGGARGPWSAGSGALVRGRRGLVRDRRRERGTGIVASEGPDFEPEVDDVELGELTAFLERAGQRD